MPGERVLVADDYEDARETYAEYLRFVGFNVTTAADGEAALRYALRREFDAIVLDVAMPKLDGLTVLRRVRQGPESKDVPVIVVSAMVDARLRAEAIQAGANRFLEKPCLPAELEHALRELMTAKD